ncbi:purine-binding chemotaxis protein CheW [Paenibacillus sp. 1_12]|uniref:chemotaxis protein CheW n=1 Tax=Paenibacillus sp. 1_12 TaxID=1566278 RepID=UPI0008DEF051|nr:chemotaxis protein CheW [Paenibacillus sp. 1_12]SFL12277.1 purine-binding chemotaxis protein CheW [Paenibacillus sp. 1_12]
MITTHQNQYIEVGIGSEQYALRIDEIHEIIKMQVITCIPNTRSYIKGVINLRGKIISIISLRARFDLMEEDYNKQTRIVVVNFMGEMVGIIVDRVNQVTSFSNIQEPPDHSGNKQNAYFSGVGHTEVGLVFILNLTNILQE